MASLWTSDSSSHPGTPAHWRVLCAAALAAASLPLALFYGYGLYAALIALLLVRPAWRDGHRSALVWVAWVAGWAGAVFGAGMMVVAVGLCGPGILVGVCSA